MRASGKPGMTEEQVASFVSRFMPAYKAYLPGLYAKVWGCVWVGGEGACMYVCWEGVCVAERGVTLRARIQGVPVRAVCVCVRRGCSFDRAHPISNCAATLQQARTSLGSSTSSIFNAMVFQILRRAPALHAGHTLSHHCDVILHHSVSAHDHSSPLALCRVLAPRALATPWSSRWTNHAALSPSSLRP